MERQSVFQANSISSCGGWEHISGNLGAANGQEAGGRGGEGDRAPELLVLTSLPLLASGVAGAVFTPFSHKIICQIGLITCFVRIYLYFHQQPHPRSSNIILLMYVYLTFDVMAPNKESNGLLSFPSEWFLVQPLVEGS